MNTLVGFGNSTVPTPAKGTFLRQCSATLACAALLGASAVGHSAIVTVDPAFLSHGYMNWFNLPASGNYPANPQGAYQGGSGWGLGDLTSYWGGPTGNSAFVGPNMMNNPDPYWYSENTNTPSGLVGNKIMDANLYAEYTGIYVDQDLTFTGKVITNSLLSKVDAIGNGWTSVAFIKDFVGNYSSYTTVTVPLTNGTFSITLHTSADPGHHIQWGFETLGPDIWATDIGNDYFVQIDPIEFTAPVITTPPAPAKAVLGNSATFTVAAAGTITGYQWKTNGVNLTDSSGKYSGTTTAELTINDCKFSDAIKYSVTVIGPSSSVSATNSLTVIDPNKITISYKDSWLGYMNWAAQPESPVGGNGASPWGTADLNAAFSGANLVLSPNTIGDPATYWYIGGGAPGNPGAKQMDANMFVEVTDLFKGATMTFSGAILSTNLLNPASTNQNGHGYTCTAFIKDFAPDYSSVIISRYDLATNTTGTFSITYTTANDIPGRHVQWGFETLGPNVWATDPILPGLGTIVLAPYPYFKLTASVTGSTVNLSFPTVTGYDYTVEWKSKITDSTWTTLTTRAGNGSTVTVPDTTGAGPRFYRAYAK